MAIETLLSLGLFAFVSSITPGPNNIMLLTSGVNYGFARTIPHILGVSLGFAILCLGLGLGLGALIQFYPILLSYLKIFALGVMVYLSWRIAFSKTLATKTKQSAKPITFIEACLFQWINPKAVVMALTAIGLYLNSAQALSSLLWIAGVFTVINLPSVSVWVLFGIGLRQFLADPQRLRIFNFTMGSLLILSIIPIILN